MRFSIPPFFETNKVYDITALQIWYDENWQKYNWIADFWRCKHCSSKRRKLPCICRQPDEQWKFLKLYEAVDEILRMNRKEDYFKNELIEYEACKFSEMNLKIWTAKNEKLGLKDCTRFMIKFLGSNLECSKQQGLRFFGNSPIELATINKVRDQLGLVGHKIDLDYEILVDKKHFKFMIEFMSVFKKAFWEQKILPESIARIVKELGEE